MLSCSSLQELYTIIFTPEAGPDIVDQSMNIGLDVPFKEEFNDHDSPEFKDMEDNLCGAVSQIL